MLKSFIKYVNNISHQIITKMQELDMIHSAVVLLTNFPSCQILVAYMSQNSAKGCLALLLLLLLATFGIPELTDISAGLFLVSLLLLFLAVLDPHSGDTSLSLPVSPHMG